MKKIILSAVFVLGSVAWTNLAWAASCDGPAGTSIVDVTQSVSNDPDSGNVSTWATDTFTKHIQVWQDATDTSVYCAQTTDNGTFMGNGTVSPEAGNPLTQIVSGTFVGGARYVITGGTFLAASSTWPLTGAVPDNTCGGDGSACPSGTYSAWISNYFSGASHSLPSWGWTYTSSDNGTWVNASTGDVGDLVHSTSTTVYNETQLKVQLADATVTTIKFGNDINVTSQVTLDHAVTIDGNGFHLTASFAKSSSSNNALIGITHDGVTIKNLIVDGAGGTNLHGINVYVSSGVVLDTVTIKNNGHAGMVVNGSDVTATDLTTSGNTWGGVNVDPGSGVTSTSTFTLVSGTLGENKQIWSDGSHVTATVPVVINVTGYSKYLLGGTTAYYIWSNKPVANYVMIVKNGFSTLYSTIQSATTAATAGDTITITPGTYTEQLSITKDLTLTGADKSTVIIKAPTSMTADTLGKKSVIDVGNGATVALSGVTVTGPGSSGCDSIDYGIFVVGTSTLNLSNSNITNIQDTPFSGCQNGIGVRVGSQALLQTGTATISNVTINTYQKGGIVIDGIGSSGTITNNTVTGVGATPSIAQNGIQISRGATGAITNNTVSAHSYTGGSGACSGDGSNAASLVDYLTNCDTSTGILLYQQGSGISIVNNTVTSSQIGVALVQGSTTATFVNNNLTGNILRGLDTDVAMTAHHNYWGSSNDPTTDKYLATSTPATYAPWYINPGRTVLDTDVTGTTVTTTASTVDFQETADGTVSLPTGVSTLTLGNDSVLTLASSTNEKVGTNIVLGGATTSLSSLTIEGTTTPVNLSVAQTIGDQTLTVEKAVTLSSGSTSQPITLTNSSLSNVSVSIPDSTTILAPNGWDGTIAPPKTVTAAGTAPSGFSVGSTVIDVGSPNAVLIFNKPVVVTLSGVTGKVGYKAAGSSQWVMINNTCTGTYSNPTGAVFPGECSISDGANTKILTYHFTTFGSLSANPAPGGASYFAGGAGSGGSSSNVVNTPAASSSTAGKVLGEQVSATASQNHGGKVLGATAYNFGRDLHIGSRGQDVALLQQMLMDGGYMRAASSTTYFGPITKAAVIKWQAKMKLPKTGYFGRLSRALVIQ